MIQRFLSQACPSVSPDWHDDLAQALHTMDQTYLNALLLQSNWLPGIHLLLSAFSIPKSCVRYILLGESPYPRKESANGYAFYDAAVGCLWADTGFSKQVNRATSLRNFLKMLLYARHDLMDDFSQSAIAQLDKTQYWQSGAEFFQNMIHRGFLLLNASLAYRDGEVRGHAKQWRPFMNSLLNALAKEPDITLLGFGRIAESVAYPATFSTLFCEHPYNISFITHPDVVQFFKPLDLLSRHDSIDKH